MMFHTSKVCILGLLLVAQCWGLPVKTQTLEKDGNKDRNRPGHGGEALSEEDLQEYMRYLEQIAGNDPALADRLSKVKGMDLAKLREMIARNPHLQERMVQSQGRNQIDEAKRMTVDRMRQLQKLQHMRDNNLMKDGDWMTKKEAIRDNLPADFTDEDIRKRLHEAQQSMEALDQRRKEEFKMQEMRAEHQRRQKLAQMNEQQRLQAEEQYRKEQEALRKHEKLPKPVSKEQLEDVWEEDDGMAKEEFNPAVFFHMHDTNADMSLDPIELEALFYSELKKVYKDDVAGLEAHEDMARMREYAMGEIDSNQDGLISLQEFLHYTGEKGYENKEEWHPVVDEENFSDKEFEDYEDDYYEDYDYEYDQDGNIVGIRPREHKQQQQQQQQQQQPHVVEGGRGDAGPPIPGGGIQIDDNKQPEQHNMDQHEQRMAPPAPAVHQPPESQNPPDNQNPPPVNHPPPPNPEQGQQQQQQQEGAPIAMDDQGVPEMAAAEDNKQEAEPEQQRVEPGQGA